MNSSSNSDIQGGNATPVNGGNATPVNGGNSATPNHNATPDAQGMMGFLTNLTPEVQMAVLNTFNNETNALTAQARAMANHAAALEGWSNAHIQQSQVFDAQNATLERLTSGRRDAIIQGFTSPRVFPSSTAMTTTATPVPRTPTTHRRNTTTTPTVAADPSRNTLLNNPHPSATMGSQATNTSPHPTSNTSPHPTQGPSGSHAAGVVSNGMRCQLFPSPTLSSPEPPQSQGPPHHKRQRLENDEDPPTKRRRKEDEADDMQKKLGACHDYIGLFLSTIPNDEEEEEEAEERRCGRCGAPIPHDVSACPACSWMEPVVGEPNHVLRAIMEQQKSMVECNGCRGKKRPDEVCFCQSLFCTRCKGMFPRELKRCPICGLGDNGNDGDHNHNNTNSNNDSSSGGGMAGGQSTSEFL